jgi:large subunit ribosomal protein L6
MKIDPTISIDIQPNQIVLTGTDKAMWGTTRQLLANKIQGVEDGFTLPLRMVGVGYRALIENEKLSLKIGVSHPVLLDIPQGIKVVIPAPQRILLQGVCWPTMTQFAASIRRYRKPEPYNQKGIFVGDETIKKKEGKKR